MKFLSVKGTGQKVGVRNIELIMEGRMDRLEREITELKRKSDDTGRRVENLENSIRKMESFFERPVLDAVMLRRVEKLETSIRKMETSQFSTKQRTKDVEQKMDSLVLRAQFLPPASKEAGKEHDTDPLTKRVKRCEERCDNIMRSVLQCMQEYDVLTREIKGRDNGQALVVKWCEKKFDAIADRFKDMSTDNDERSQREAVLTSPSIPLLEHVL